MAQKSSKLSNLTLIEAVNLYRLLTQAQFDQQMLYFSLSLDTKGGAEQANALTSRNRDFGSSAVVKRSFLSDQPSGKGPLMKEGQAKDLKETCSTG